LAENSICSQSISAADVIASVVYKDKYARERIEAYGQVNREILRQMVVRQEPNKS